MSTLRTGGTEYEALHAACGVLDVSDRGKLALSGDQTKEFLQGQITNDVEGLVPGTGCYAALLTPKGKMLGDLRVLDSGPELLLDTERSALQELFNMIRRFRVGWKVELHKRTLERGLLSLIGPRAEEVAGAEGLPNEEHSHRLLIIEGIEARAIRAPGGLDLLCGGEDSRGLREALIDRGAVSVGQEATEIVRIESGRPRYGIDLDDSVIPQEAGLNDRAVSFTKGCYVGQETVARLFYRGRPNRQLRGLRCVESVEPGDEVVYENKVVGTVSSAAVSPRLGALALALVRREAPVGTSVRVGSTAVAAEVSELPFA